MIPKILRNKSNIFEIPIDLTEKKKFEEFKIYFLKADE